MSHVNAYCTSYLTLCCSIHITGLSRQRTGGSKETRQEHTHVAICFVLFGFVFCCPQGIHGNMGSSSRAGYSRPSWRGWGSPPWITGARPPMNYPRIRIHACPRAWRPHQPAGRWTHPNGQRHGGSAAGNHTAHLQNRRSSHILADVPNQIENPRPKQGAPGTDLSARAEHNGAHRIANLSQGMRHPVQHHTDRHERAGGIKNGHSTMKRRKKKISKSRNKRQA